MDINEGDIVMLTDEFFPKGELCTVIGYIGDYKCPCCDIRFDDAVCVGLRNGSNVVVRKVQLTSCEGMQ